MSYSRVSNAVVQVLQQHDNQWLDNKQLLNYLPSLSSKQLSNALSRLTFNEHITRVKKGNKCLYSVVGQTTGKQIALLPHNDSSLDAAIEAVSVIASQREQYRSALLKIQQIIVQALEHHDGKDT